MVLSEELIKLGKNTAKLPGEIYKDITSDDDDNKQLDSVGRVEKIGKGLVKAGLDLITFNWI